MKAILEFNLPEDQGELDLAMMARTMYSAIWDVDHLLRNHLKHGEQKNAEKVMERCVKELAEIVERGL